MTAILVLAQKEFRDAWRNRWILSVIVLLVVFAVSLSYLGSAPTGDLKVNILQINLVSLASLSVFILPLISLLMAYNTISSEIENNTFNLLLSYPLSRSGILLGKYLGHLLILFCAIASAYLATAGVLYYKHPELNKLALWSPYFAFMFSSFALAAVFLSLAYLLSVSVKESASAAGLAIIIWLFFVFIYDLILLLILLSEHGKFIKAETLNFLLLLNPSDVFRIYNLYDLGINYSDLSALSSYSNIKKSQLLISLILWIFLPLIAANFILKKRKL